MKSGPYPSASPPPFGPSSAASAMTVASISPAAARVVYGKRAYKSLALKALTWPWRTKEGSWAVVAMMLGTMAAGAITNTPAWFCAALLSTVPYVAIAARDANKTIRRRLTLLFDEEVVRIAAEDGVAVNPEQGEES
jgi:hypothetical protein